ncbi:MAG: hypothetical protein HY927_12850 [Elusimicrobia bacterium]|nr:hypothetical protein [Elusimicrobiota bacterium]
MAKARGSPWAGRSVLITSGPTREYLDPVRYLSNASSGKMGRALAAEAGRLGAWVTVVSGPAEVPPPPGVRVVPVVTAAQMRAAVLRLSPGADVVIGAAAVADWRFGSPSRRKIKRTAAALRLTLLPNPDIIKEVAERRRSRGPRRGGRRQIVAGFALESGRGAGGAVIEAARRKLAAKGLDLVVANGPRALGSDRARFSIVTAGGALRLGVLSKEEAARRIFSALGAMMAAPDRREGTA